MGKRGFSAVYHYPTAVSTSVQEKKQSQLLVVVADTLMGVQRGKQVKEDSISVSIVLNSSSNMSSPSLRLNQ